MYPNTAAWNAALTSVRPWRKSLPPDLEQKKSTFVICYEKLYESIPTWLSQKLPPGTGRAVPATSELHPSLWWFPPHWGQHKHPFLSGWGKWLSWQMIHFKTWQRVKHSSREHSEGGRWELQTCGVNWAVEVGTPWILGAPGQCHVGLLQLET